MLARYNEMGSHHLEVEEAGIARPQGRIDALIDAEAVRRRSGGGPEPFEVGIARPELLADWIKIHASGSIPTRSGELQVWTLDELKAVCDTAHALGVPVTAHCRNASSTRAVALAGVDLILQLTYERAMGAH